MQLEDVDFSGFLQKGWFVGTASLDTVPAHLVIPPTVAYMFSCTDQFGGNVGSSAATVEVTRRRRRRTMFLGERSTN